MKYRTLRDEGIRFISNESLPFVDDTRRGNIIIGKQFTNAKLKDEQPFWNLIKWRFSINPQAHEKKLDDFQLPIFQNDDLFFADRDMVAWLGHSSFFIRINGINLITDPVFYDWLHIRRKCTLACELKAVRNVKHVLLSHAHMDHYDVRSIKDLLKSHGSDKLSFLGPLMIEKLVKDTGGAILQEAAWYQRYQLDDDVEITYLPAKHWHRRGLFDYNTILWGSFWIKARGLNIYFAGDTAYGEHFKDIFKAMGPADICLMPVGAYSPRYMMRDSHMNPQEAVNAFHELGGKVFIPMHYGTFDLSDEPLGEPYRVLQNMYAEGRIKGTLKLLGIGEVFNLDEHALDPPVLLPVE